MRPTEDAICPETLLFASAAFISTRQSFLASAANVVVRLREMGINTSATLRWYGLKDFETTPVQSALRVSPHYYNTEREVESAAAAIADFLR